MLARVNASARVLVARCNVIVGMFARALDRGEVGWQEGMLQYGLLLAIGQFLFQHVPL